MLPANYVMHSITAEVGAFFNGQTSSRGFSMFFVILTAVFYENISCMAWIGSCARAVEKLSGNTFRTAWGSTGGKNV